MIVALLFCILSTIWLGVFVCSIQKIFAICVSTVIFGVCIGGIMSVASVPSEKNTFYALIITCLCFFGWDVYFFSCMLGLWSTSVSMGC